ncbi:MAG: hypothetical protein HZB21_00350 [Deltaproteobacteria bacterium]|nr:hypothetical protein [Deltaproteobacteria bacterium]
MIEKMTKVQIIGPKGLLDECIKTLHAMSIVHIETVPSDIGLAEEAFLRRLPMEKEKVKEKEALDNVLDKIKGLMLLLKPPASYRSVTVGWADMWRLADELAPMGEEVRRVSAGLEGLKEELAVIGKYERLLRGFAPVVPRLGGLKNFDIVGLTVEKTRGGIVALLDLEVSKITGGAYEIYVQEIDDATTGVVLAYPRKFEPMVRQLLSGRSISEIKLPEGYGEMPLLDALKEMERKKGAIPRLIREGTDRLSYISGRWYWTLVAMMKAAEDRLDEIGALAYAGQTMFAFVIEGWVPADMFGGVHGKFNSIFGGKVMVREMEVREEDIDFIPVYIKNPRLLRPFEVLLSALPPPKYGSVDPTPYIAFFFPAFFGLIVGDIGYGAVILILSFYLKRRFRDKEMLKDISSVLSAGSLSAIVFGFLFGEFFGDLGMRLGIIHPILLNRALALRTFLVLTLGIGAGHVLLGLVIGAVNRLHRGRRKEAGVKAAHFVMAVSFLVVMGILWGYLPKGLFTPGLAALVVSFAALILLEGIIGPLEVIKSVGNMLSYVRLMAVGTASVVMAVVANRIGGLSDDIILGIIAAALIHLLNIVISVVSPAIQSMRLHYVEFFSKFYEGGGKRYAPFKKR